MPSVRHGPKSSSLQNLLQNLRNLTEKLQLSPPRSSYIIQPIGQVSKLTVGAFLPISQMQLTDSLPRLACIRYRRWAIFEAFYVLLLLHYDESMRAHGLTYSCIAYSVCMYY